MIPDTLQMDGGAAPQDAQEKPQTAVGAVSTQPMEDTPSTAHVDAERGVFITSYGDELELTGQRISALMLERLTNEGKPKIPMIEVTILGKHKQMQANPNDPGYLALVREWEADQSIRVMRYMFCLGVKVEKDEKYDAFVELHRQFMPDATDLDLKYLWVSSIVPNKDVDKFTDALLGQWGVTTKGIDEAANFSASK
jgi:hypothetical protein